MHLNQIHSFLAVSKTLNFTGAARQLGVPQSTISRQVHDLESQLGVRLFYRTKRDVQLTDEGRIFLPFAQEISDAARKGAFAVRQLHEGASGRLSIAAVPACRGFLTECLAVFHDRHPDIAVDIASLSPGESIVDDTQFPYDFCFLYRDMLLDPDSFDYQHIHRDPLCLVRRSARKPAPSMPARHTSPGRSAANEEPAADPHAKSGPSAAADAPAADSAVKKDPAILASDHRDLASADFILLSEETDPILYMQTLNYCRTHRFTPRVANTFPELSSVLLSVSAGLGVSILPQSILPAPCTAGRTTEAFTSACPTGIQVQELPEASALEVLPLEDDSYTLDCIAAWKPSLLNPAAALFLKLLQAQAQE